MQSDCTAPPLRGIRPQELGVEVGFRSHGADALPIEQLDYLIATFPWGRQSFSQELLFQVITEHGHYSIETRVACRQEHSPPRRRCQSP